MRAKLLRVGPVHGSATGLPPADGFNYVVSKFRNLPIAAHIELQKSERSELAELAANTL